MLLSPDEKTLYVALSNLDQIAEVSTRDGTVTGYFSTTPSAQEFPGAYPTALAQSSDGKYLFVANSSLDAVAVFDTSTASPVSNSQDPQAGMGFIPTDWYPSALAVQGNDLLIATAKGEGAGPNKQMGKTAGRDQTSPARLYRHPHQGIGRPAEHCIYFRTASAVHADGGAGQPI